MKILFVCKYNRFRSKVAEAIFNSLNKNENVFTDSAGFMLDILHSYVEPEVIEIVRGKGYEMENSDSKVLSKEFLENGNFDLVVVTANNVSLEIFSGFDFKVEQWDIQDCSIVDLDCTHKTIDKIEKKIKGLVKRFN